MENKIKSLLLLLLSFCISLSFTKCSNDNDEGKLEIEFLETPQSVEIFAAENDESPIIIREMKESDKILILSLNSGNYIIRPYKYGHSYGRKGVQIRAGKTSYVIFDK